jgi:N-methylhydantoinase A/oxoprolinase/acetone carboxylase beta subunit
MRFATDTGGTFTDLVIEREGQLHLFKSPTVPSNPVEGVLGAFSVAAEAFGMERSELLGRGTQSIHGTTHAINAIVTGLVARTALLVSDGHPDRESIQLFERGLSFGGTLLRAPEVTREIVLAIVLLAVLIFRPQGLVGEREAGERK